ncbi:trigger factor [Desulfosarcina sp. OttesenSCG-928-A07]|nr:trigger factor [Desulfosarcina sp. OttesenSCG-928-G17]MDL2329230.1 trigger factor [Desulfosarcina sp. OttesenSCG-928-A07]
MNVHVEDRSPVKKVLHIEIPQEDVIRALDDAYQSLKKTAKIKGFRPGKAPRRVLEQLYQKDVMADVRGKLIQDAYVEALDQTRLNIVGPPVLDPPELDASADYRFDAEVEVMPEIADITFTGLKLTQTDYEASDEEVALQIQMLQKNLSKREVIDEDRPARKDDFVRIDYEGFKEGTPFAGTQKTENFIMRLGDGHIAEALDQGVAGMSVGEEKVIPVSFPEDYFNTQLAGQTVDFHVKLNDIRKEVTPEIDDAFAAQIGPFTTMDEVRQKIRQNLAEGYTKRTEQELNEQIFSQILETTQFDVPDVMVENELDHIASEMERSLSYNNKTLEETGLTRKILAEKYRDVAEKQVRRQLILGKLIEQEKLELSDADLEAGFADMAQTYGQSVDVMKQIYENNDKFLAFFKHALLEKRAIKLIMDSNTIESVAPAKEAPDASDDDADEAAHPV